MRSIEERREANRLWMQRWRATHREEWLAGARKYKPSQEVKERAKARSAKFRIENLESVRAKARERAKKHYRKHREEIAARRQPTDKSRAQRREYTQRKRADINALARASQKRRRQEDGERIRARDRTYSRVKREKNKEQWRAQERARFNKRYYSDPLYRVLITYRARLGSAIRRFKAQKATSTVKLVGCQIDSLIAWLEAGFKPGMSWENYGRDGWHVDHVKPCAAFDLSDPAQQRQCFHFTNLQPLWASENMSKGNKLS